MVVVVVAQRRSPVAVPVVGIDGTDRLPGSGWWRVHNQVSMPRNLRFCSHDGRTVSNYIDNYIYIRVTLFVLRFERGSSPPNCFIHFFKLYVIVHLCTFRIAFELKIVDTSSYSNFDLFNGFLTIYADVRFEKVTRAARFIETITMFPFSKTKHVR